MSSERVSTRNREFGLYMPKSTSRQSWHRFDQDRRRGYLARIDGKPSPRQIALLDNMVRLEWAALVAEKTDGSLRALREAREHRRLFQRLFDDFERTLAPAPTKTRRL